MAEGLHSNRNINVWCYIRMDKIRNYYVRGSLKVALVTEKIKSKRLACYGHIMRRNKNNVTKRMLRSKKRWADYVIEEIIGVKGLACTLKACWS